MKPILVAQQLSYKFPQKTLFTNFNLEVRKGECLVFIGNNGTGKSTLLKILSGILPAQTGNVQVDPKLKKVYLGQLDFAKYDQFPATAYEVVMSAFSASLGLFKFPSELQKKEALTMLSQLGLEKHVHQQLSQLSGGQRQRVFMAKALLQKPDILFLDEPNSALDATFTLELFKRLKLEQDKGLTLLMVTHDLALGQMVADRILCVEEHDILQLHEEDIVDELAHRHQHLGDHHHV